MRKQMKLRQLFSLLAMALLLAGLGVAQAASREIKPMGDEDPFPLSCVDFSGSWNADDGSTYDIAQKACARLRMQVQTMDKSFSTKALVIVPDNKQRSIRSRDFVGNVRHRWNSKNNATTIESYRYLKFDDHEEYQVVFLEQVNESLMLESTYETIVPVKGDTVRNYVQKIFRKAAN